MAGLQLHKTVMNTTPETAHSAIWVTTAQCEAGMGEVSSLCCRIDTVPAPNRAAPPLRPAAAVFGSVSVVRAARSHSTADHTAMTVAERPAVNGRLMSKGENG